MGKKEKTILDSRMAKAESEIDLVDLFLYLKSKFVIIFIALVLGGVAAGGYSYYRIQPTYKAASYIYMVSASSDSMIDLSDLNIGTSISEDYKQLLLRRPVIGNVIGAVEGLSVKGEGDKESDIMVLNDATDLAGHISLSTVGQSRVLKIEVVTTDPRLSKDIANAFANQAVKYIPEITQSSAPTIAEYAVKPTTKAGPSNTKNAILGALIAVIIVCGYYTAKYLLDDSIKSEDDLEKYFGIIAMTSIPEGDIKFGDDELSVKGKKNKKRGNK